MTNETPREPINIAEEEQRVLAAFGDVRGFRSWVKRCGTTQLRRSYGQLQELWIKFSERADLYKSLGDGFMAVWELRSTHNCRLAIDLYHLSVETAAEMQLIRLGMPEPRFTGWRIRWVAGDAFKWTRNSGRRREVDYIGQRINLCKELLYVYPEESIILHESAWELFSDAQASKEGFVLNPVPYKKYPELNIFDEDLRGCKRLERINQGDVSGG